MRYIPTSTAIVESLKKQAKKLQRKGGGKHSELLDRVAKTAGYQHWHHVTLCHQETQAKRGIEALHDDCEIILRAAQDGIEKVIVTDLGEVAAPFVLFSSQRDAWLLDVDEGLAHCLMFQGAMQERHFEDSDSQIRIGWDGTYALDGAVFAVATEHPAVGVRAITGYPLEELRKWIDKAQSLQKRFNTLIAQDDALELSPKLAEQLIATGWDAKNIEEARAYGARYSPSRNSLLYPPVPGSFDDASGEGSAAA